MPARMDRQRLPDASVQHALPERRNMFGTQHMRLSQRVDGANLRDAGLLAGLSKWRNMFGTQYMFLCLGLDRCDLCDASVPNGRFASLVRLRIFAPG